MVRCYCFPGRRYTKREVRVQGGGVGFFPLFPLLRHSAAGHKRPRQLRQPGRRHRRACAAHELPHKERLLRVQPQHVVRRGHGSHAPRHRRHIVHEPHRPAPQHLKHRQTHLVHLLARRQPPLLTALVLPERRDARGEQEEEVPDRARDRVPLQRRRHRVALLLVPHLVRRRRRRALRREVAREAGHAQGLQEAPVVAALHARVHLELVRDGAQALRAVLHHQARDGDLRCDLRRQHGKGARGVRRRILQVGGTHLLAPRLAAALRLLQLLLEGHQRVHEHDVVAEPELRTRPHEGACGEGDGRVHFF
eukprot:Rhum_TRINITY_DN15470_c7_g8::Rhum_TRINITY_DN15470_c7_g8_i1::g.158690::m.158690